MNKAGDSKSDQGTLDKIARQDRGQRRRQEIIDCATRLLLESGFDGVVLRDVASSVGVQLSSLHYYFPTRSDLVLAIFDHESTAYEEELLASISHHKNIDGKVAAIVDTALNVIKGPEAKLWRLLTAYAQHNHNAAELFFRENKLFHTVTARALRNIEPTLTGKRSMHIAQLFWAMIDGLALQTTDATNLDTVSLVETEIKTTFNAMIHSAKNI